MISQDQMTKPLLDIVVEESKLFKDNISITERNDIPDTSDIPIENPLHWYKIRGVICVPGSLALAVGMYRF